MMRLKSRQKFIPNGFRFYLPELKWQAPTMRSFDTVCQALQAVVKANPVLAKKHKWPSDLHAIEDWVDLYNATVCAKMGWDDYITTTEGFSIPKPSAPHQQALLQNLKAAAVAARELVSGAKSLTEWQGSGESSVSPELALARAQVCAACPLNSKEDLTKWFTVPAAELIKRQVEKAQSQKLTTPADDDLHLCTACHCPLKLKVHVPIVWIAKRLTPEQKAKLQGGKNCWILAEMAA